MRDKAGEGTKVDLYLKPGVRMVKKQDQEQQETKQQEEKLDNVVIQTLKLANPAELREARLVGEPGVVSAAIGWHDLKHLCTPGAGNRAQGAFGIGSRITAAALAARLLLEKYVK